MGKKKKKAGCLSCREAMDKPWDKEQVQTEATELCHRMGAMSQEQVEERVSMCDVCPFREGQVCLKARMPIISMLMARADCPENFWPLLGQVPPDIIDGISVDDNGNIYLVDEKRIIPSPCGNCIFRNRSVRYYEDKLPEVVPFCSLPDVNKTVTWKDCCECPVRQPVAPAPNCTTSDEEAEELRTAIRKAREADGDVQVDESLRFNLTAEDPDHPNAQAYIDRAEKQSEE